MKQFLQKANIKINNGRVRELFQVTLTVLTQLISS